MGTTNDQSALVGNFIDAWGTNVPELFKFMAPLANRINFEEGNLIGGKYHVLVDLQQEHGFTYAAAGSTPTLLNAVAGQTGDVQVEGSQIYGRSNVSYEAIMRSQQEGKQAVRNATKFVVKRLGRSGTKRLEVDILHGRRGIGVLGNISGTSTTRVLTIDDASWAAGIWAGMENCTLDARRTVTTYADTKINSNAAIVVTAIDIENKQLSVSGNSTDLTSLDSYGTSAILFFETSSPTTSMAGIDTIVRNTGTLFNVSASTYALWGGNTYAGGTTGTPSMAKFLNGLSQAASFGLQGMKATLIVSPKCFEVLNSDQAALREYDVSYRAATAENGAEGLMYHGQTGPLEILPHAFEKDGMAHLIVEEEMHRIGASDLSFVDRGGPQPRLILESSTTPASEMRVQSHQAIYCEYPRHMVLFDGLTYS